MILNNAHPIMGEMVGVVNKSGRGFQFCVRFAHTSLSTPLCKILDTPLQLMIFIDPMAQKKFFFKLSPSHIL